MFTRYNGNVVPFANDATLTNRTVFGGTTQSDNIDDNLNADFKKGWEIVGLNDNPTREDFNAMGYTLGALTSYLYQMGIAEWNNNQEYTTNSIAIGSDGNVYKSSTGPNIGNDPTSDSVNWDKIDAEVNINALTDKTTIATDDEFVIADSADSYSLKKITKSTLANQLTGGVTSGGLLYSSGVLSFYPYGLTTATTELTTADYVIVSDSTVAKKITITNFASEYSLGWGQTWQNVTASRSAGVTYTNSTGKPIEVAIRTGAGNYLFTLTVDGIGVCYLDLESGITGTLGAIIPNGSTYTVSTGGGILSSWLELR